MTSRRGNTLDRPMVKARELADRLLHAYEEHPGDKRTDETRAALAELAWPLRSKEELVDACQTARKAAFLACQRLKAERVIPALVDAASRHYSKTFSTTRHCRWLGPALKICIALVWDNLDRGTALTSAPATIHVAVAKCAAYMELVSLQYLCEIETDAFTEPIEIIGGDIQLPSRLQAAREAFELARPGGLRAPDAGALRLASDITGTRAAIAAVLDGSKKPGDLPQFADTVLAKLQADDPPALWNHLWMTLEMAYVVTSVSMKLHGHAEGVVLIPRRFPATLPLQPLPVAVRNDLLFWNTDWYRSLEPHDVVNAILERPVVRCSSHPGFYATCVIFVLDAFAWAIEAAFFRYPRMEPLHLDQDRFEDAFADELERRVIEICRDLGLEAGEVTKNGTWMCGQKRDLAAEAGKPCPGQIDCLVSSDNVIVILECKVLHLPQTPSKALNQLGKLGADDDEGIHARLRKKARWIQAALRLPVRAAVVVDRAPPRHDLVTEHPIVHLRDLPNWLETALAPATPESLTDGAEHSVAPQDVITSAHESAIDPT